MASTARAEAHRARLTPPRCHSPRYGALSCGVLLDASACRPPLNHERHHQTCAEGDVDRGDVRGAQMVFEAGRETLRHDNVIADGCGDRRRRGERNPMRALATVLSTHVIIRSPVIADV